MFLKESTYLELLQEFGFQDCKPVTTPIDCSSTSKTKSLAPYGVMFFCTGD